MRPDGVEYVTKQLYLPGTAILLTRFMTESGVGEVIDFMPVADGPATDRHRLVRLVRVVRGTMTFVAEIQPRFDYGRADHQTTVTDEGTVFTSDDLTLTVHRVGDPVVRGANRAGVVDVVDRGVRVTTTLRAGEVTGLMLESGGAAPQQISREELLALYDDTHAYWQSWLAKSTYTGRWREAVTRSAMTLKLLTYAPTGAMVAAPTASLPEQVGGERNWDYRYTWVRDASFSVHALLGLGYTDEAAAFVSWLGDRIAESAGAASGPLKIMYRVDGSSDLVGGDARPTSTATADRTRCVSATAPPTSSSSTSTARPWTRSIWPTRVVSRSRTRPGPRFAKCSTGCATTGTGPRRASGRHAAGSSRSRTVGSCAGWRSTAPSASLDQAGALRRSSRWTLERDRIYEQIMTRGWHPNRKAFVQHYDTDVLDASLLLMPLMGFVAPHDPMWLSTLAAMDDELVSDSLVYRYDPSASPDGLRGSEGTFTLCSFFYVDALARSGRLDEAQLTFEKMLTYANHLGLYAEEIGLTGEQLGNFPQAFSHLALINAAVNLDYQLDHGADQVDPVLRAGFHGTRP